MVYYSILTIVPCAMEQFLVVCLFYVQQFAPANSKLLIYPFPSPSLSPLVTPKFFFFFLFIKFIYLFNLFIFGCVGSSLLCVRAFSSCSEWGPLFIAVRGLLFVVAFLVAEHGVQTCGLQQLWLTGSVVVARGLSCSAALPRPGLEPVSPALAGGFLTTAPPGQPPVFVFYV